MKKNHALLFSQPSLILLRTYLFAVHVTVTVQRGILDGHTVGPCDVCDEKRKKKTRKRADETGKIKTTVITLDARKRTLFSPSFRFPDV